MHESPDLKLPDPLLDDLLDAGVLGRHVERDFSRPAYEVSTLPRTAIEGFAVVGMVWTKAFVCNRCAAERAADKRHEQHDINHGATHRQ
jgi:hypothetical protein